MNALTQYQTQTLHVVATWRTHVGRDPSLRELARMLGITRRSAQARMWWLTKKLGCTAIH